MKRSSGCLGRLAILVSLTLFVSACSKPDQARLVDQRGPIEPRRVAFHPSDPDRVLVVEANGVVSVWRIADPKQPEKLLSIAAKALDAQFLPGQERIVTGGQDGTVAAWDSDGREVWRSKKSHDGEIRALAVGPGLVATAGQDGTIRLWAPDGSELGPPLTGHEGMVLAVAVSPGGEWLASEGADTTIRLWRLGGGKAGAEAARVFRDPIPMYRKMLPGLVKLDVQWGWDRSVAFSPRGDVLAATGLDGSVRLWDLNGSPRSEALKGHSPHHVRSVAFSPRGDVFATGGFDGTVKLWNLDGSGHGKPFVGHERKVVFSVAFAPGGKRLVSAGLDNTVRLWNSDGSPQGTLPRGAVGRPRRAGR